LKLTKNKNEVTELLFAKIIITRTRSEWNSMHYALIKEILLIRISNFQFIIEKHQLDAAR